MSRPTTSERQEEAAAGEQGRKGPCGKARTQRRSSCSPLHQGCPLHGESGGGEPKDDLGNPFSPAILPAA